MPKKSTDRPHKLPEKTSRSKQSDFKKLDVSNSAQERGHLQENLRMLNADQPQERGTNFMTEKRNDSDAGSTHETENERLKELRKNRKKGWNDIL